MWIFHTVQILVEIIFKSVSGVKYDTPTIKVNLQKTYSSSIALGISIGKKTPMK